MPSPCRRRVCSLTGPPSITKVIFCGSSAGGGPQASTCGRKPNRRPVETQAAAAVGRWRRTWGGPRGILLIAGRWEACGRWGRGQRLANLREGTVLGILRDLGGIGGRRPLAAAASASGLAAASASASRPACQLAGVFGLRLLLAFLLLRRLALLLLLALLALPVLLEGSRARLASPPPLPPCGCGLLLRGWRQRGGKRHRGERAVGLQVGVRELGVVGLYPVAPLRLQESSRRSGRGQRRPALGFEGMQAEEAPSSGQAGTRATRGTGKGWGFGGKAPGAREGHQESQWAEAANKREERCGWRGRRLG